MSPLPKNDKPIDITQIAQALGVSKATVSRAISGNGRISTATRQRVLDYVKTELYPQYDGARAGEALLLQYFAGDFHAIFRL